MKTPTLVATPPPVHYRPHGAVVTEAHDVELLLLHLEKGTTYRLNATGRFGWEQLVTGTSIAAIVDDLHARFGGPRGRIERDVETLLADLVAGELLDVVPAEMP